MYRLNMHPVSFELNETHLDKSSYAAVWNDPLVLEQLHRAPGDRETFLLHDGPPYANGDLHMGHFVNKTLKDALLKHKRLAGVFAPFVPGFDCHGLPVELEVEKSGRLKEDPLAFVEACRAYALTQVERQTAQFQSFGVSADWQNPYRTMDPSFEVGAARLFSTMPHRVKRFRPVHWCAQCNSSLAEAEVEYELKSSDSVVVLFEVLEAPDRNLVGAMLEVWTTTPYTLPANRAVGYHPQTRYAVFNDDTTGRRVRADANEGAAASLQGVWVRSPWTGQRVPLLEADYVTSAGTGLVHLAPSFGVDDFRVCEAHGLYAEDLVSPEGRYREGAVAGLTLSEASKAVMQGLSSTGLLAQHEMVKHEYPHCWRHKKPLFFRASEEWFLDVSQFRDTAEDALKGVSFLPEAGRERLASMVRARTSWCLSRSRLWGTPLATCPEDVELLDSGAVQGCEAWQSEGARRTLDVWFDSGVTHTLVMKERFGRHADLYLEGSDQHRGWFQSSLLTSVATERVAPFREVMTHGFVVDAVGKKLSKSSKNYVPLAKLLEKYSPDVLRLWALQQDCTKDLRMSQESLDRAVDRYRKLRNTVRFCLQNTVDYAPEQHRTPSDCLVDQMQLRELATLVRESQEAGARYDFPSGVSALVQFCERTSADYFTAAKDVLYCDATASRRRRQMQTVLEQVLLGLLKALTPLMPFTAEQVHQVLLSRGWNLPVSSLLLRWDTCEPAGQVVRAVPFDAMATLKSEVQRLAEVGRTPELKSAASFDATVTAPGELAPLELREVLGCANVCVQPGSDFGVTVQPTTWAACPRCRRPQPLFCGLLCVRCEAAERQE